MVLKRMVVRLAARATDAPEPALFRRERYAAVENRATRLKTDLYYPLSFPYLFAGATRMPGQPFRGSKSRLPSLIGNITPTTDLAATEPIRTVHRCLSIKAARRPVNAAGRGRVQTAIRALHSPVRFTDHVV